MPEAAVGGSIGPDLRSSLSSTIFRTSGWVRQSPSAIVNFQRPWASPWARSRGEAEIFWMLRVEFEGRNVGEIAVDNGDGTSRPLRAVGLRFQIGLPRSGL